MTPALHQGKAVHAALQAFHLARWRGTDDSPEAVAAAFDQAFHRLERDEGPVRFDDDTERQKNRIDGLRMVAACLDSPEVLRAKPRAVEVLLREEIPGLSVPLTGAMDLVRGNFTPVDFKSAAAKPDPAGAAFDHEIQLVSYQMLGEAATGETPPSLDLVPALHRPDRPAGNELRRGERLAQVLSAMAHVGGPAHDTAEHRAAVPADVGDRWPLSDQQSPTLELPQRGHHDLAADAQFSRQPVLPRHHPAPPPLQQPLAQVCRHLLATR